MRPFNCKSFRFAIILVFLGGNVFAHGEDKLGPNKGFIRMPGPFHIEAVPVFKKSSNEEIEKINFYLLDINWKNPSVKDSKMKVKYFVKEKEATELICQKYDSFYQCNIPANIKVSSGTISVSAEREGIKGILVTYKIPFKLQNSESLNPAGNNDAHSGHH